ncbi:phage tail protein [Enterobacter hormaechei]
MSQTVITQAFEALKAQEAANGGVVTLDEFVFASVPNLNISDPIDRSEGLPPAAQIVHRQAVSKTGMVNSNAVVYSVVLGADVGDFEFNWVGLLNKASGAVAMIVHAPHQKKIKTASGQQGNVLTRSFLMEYNGASTQTQITTPADTWQIDFTARMNGADERIRQENIDVYGQVSFLNDGFLVTAENGSYQVKKGVAYIEGLRAELQFDQTMAVASKPTKIWVDVCWRGTLTSVWAPAVKLTVADNLENYVSGDEQHYVSAIANILADGSVVDLRKANSLAQVAGLNASPDTVLYFDKQSKLKKSPISDFIRAVLASPDAGDILESLGFLSGKYQFVGSADNVLQAPEKLVYGPGKVTHSGHVFESFIPGFDILHSSIYMTPEDAIYGAGIGFPTDGNGNFNLFMSIGAHPERAAGLTRTTAIGTNNFVHPINIDRCEAIGNTALQHMRFGERTTAIGTTSCQYLGTNDPQGDGHNWFGTEESGGLLPGQPGWDYGGFETANPGIGAKIAAFRDFAQAPAECGRVVAVGRNTLNGTVRARNSVALGYRAAASAYAVEGLNAVGTDAFRNAIFVSTSDAFGYLAAAQWQEGQRNLIAGYQGAAAVVRGSNSIHLGPFAGSSFTDSNWNLFLGVGAGNNISATNLTPSYCLAIGHDIQGNLGSLIAGRMDTRVMGVNTLPDKIKGTLHVRTGDYGPDTAAHSNADDLIVESSNNTGVTLRSGENNFGSLMFASPISQNRAGIIYNHANDTMSLRAGGGDRFLVDSAALAPASDNTLAIGKPSNRPSVIYAGTAAINTSDARSKTEVEELNSIERIVALKLKALIRRYKFLDAIADKGEEARYHIGIIAQEVKAAFESEGLIAEQYGILCYDEWNDEYQTIPAETVFHPAKYSVLVDAEGNPLIVQEAWEEVVKPEERIQTIEAGSRYGIRYEELLCFIMGAI